MELSEKVDKSKRYLLGVSGGSDSMALASLCVKAGLDLVVCHINYKLRVSADGEEELVRDFCFENDIPIEVLYPQQEEKGNFQQWAREVRYNFYKEVYDRYNCYGLLLGHQLDDHIENYLMSLERKSHGWFYGISEETFHHGMRIIRPLLKYRKRDLKKYCDDNEIVYHDDESNFTDKYQRNRIRHSMVETASDEQIQKWVDEIDEINRRQKQMLDLFEKKYGSCETISIRQFRSESRRRDLLRWLIWKYEPGYNYSSKQVSEMIHVLLTSNRNGYLILKGGHELVFEYGHFYIWKPEGRYEYKLDHLEYFSTAAFTLADKGETIQSVTVTEKDFPLTIRPYSNDDFIQLRYGTKKVSRFLIDRKISRRERYLWPVIVNADGEVIFVRGIGCDVAHYTVNANLFMIE